MTGCAKPRRRAQRGFTLVEVLIAISLLGLMLVILFGGLRLGGRSWDAIEQRTGASSEMRLVREFVRRSLRQIQGPLMKHSEGRRLVFSGDAEAIEFVTPLGGYLGLGGAYVVRLQSRRTNKGDQLVLSRWLYHPEVLEGGDGIPEWQLLAETSGLVSSLKDAEDPEKREYFGRQVLLESVEELEFSYFGRLSEEEEAGWHDEWNDPRRLPDLVRMRLQQTTGWWPDLYVRLPATYSPGSSGGRTLPGAF